MSKREPFVVSNTQGRSGFSRRDVLVNAALVGTGVAIGRLWFAACADQSNDARNRGDQAVARRKETAYSSRVRSWGSALSHGDRWGWAT